MLYLEFKPEDRKKVENYIAVYASGTGDVYYREAYQTNWDAIQVGDKMSPSSHIATGPKSKASIILNDGYSIQLDENSQINLAIADDRLKDNYTVDVIQGNLQIAKSISSSPEKKSVMKTIVENLTEQKPYLLEFKKFITEVAEPKEKTIIVKTKDYALNIPKNAPVLNFNATEAETKVTTTDGKEYKKPEELKDDLTDALTDEPGKSAGGKASNKLNQDSNTPPDELQQASEMSSNGNDDLTMEMETNESPSLPVIKMSDLPEFEKKINRNYDGVIIWDDTFSSVEALRSIRIKTRTPIPLGQTFELHVFSTAQPDSIIKLEPDSMSNQDMKFTIPKSKFIDWLGVAKQPVEINWRLFLTNEPSEVKDTALFSDSLRFLSIPQLEGKQFILKIENTPSAPSKKFTFYRANLNAPSTNYEVEDKSLMRKLAEGKNQGRILEIVPNNEKIKVPVNTVETLFVKDRQVIFRTNNNFSKEKISDILTEIGAEFAFKGKSTDLLTQENIRSFIDSSESQKFKFLTLMQNFPAQVKLAPFKASEMKIALSQSDDLFVKGAPEIIKLRANQRPESGLKTKLTQGIEPTTQASQTVAFLNIDRTGKFTWKKKDELNLNNLRTFRDANPEILSANFVVNGLSISSFFKGQKENKAIFEFVEKTAKCDLLIVTKEVNDKINQVSLFYKPVNRSTLNLLNNSLDKNNFSRWVYESLGYDAIGTSRIIDSYVYLTSYPRKINKNNQGFIWPNSEKSIFFNTKDHTSTPYLFQCEIPDEAGCIAKIFYKSKIPLSSISEMKVTLLGRTTLDEPMESGRSATSH